MAISGPSVNSIDCAPPLYSEAMNESERQVPPAGGARRETIVLIGMMGAGKSAVGRRLAKQLDLPFVDADGEIETAAGCTIGELFAREGEAQFREGERRVMVRLLSGAPCVLAAGGGAFLDAGTRAAVAAAGVSVWLRADIDTLLARTKHRRHRPLLNTDNPRAVLETLAAAREATYALADVAVDSAAGPVESTVAAVLDALQDRHHQDRHHD